MTEQPQDDDTTAESDAVKLSLVGGFVGTVVGSYRGRAGAVVGGLVGGALGYVAGTTTETPVETAEDPVVVTVEDADDTDAQTE